MIGELPPGYVLTPKQFGDLQVPLIRPSVAGFLMGHHLSNRMSGEQRFEYVDGVALPDNKRCAKFGQRSVQVPERCNKHVLLTSARIFQRPVAGFEDIKRYHHAEACVKQRRMVADTKITLEPNNAKWGVMGHAVGTQWPKAGIGLTGSNTPL